MIGVELPGREQILRQRMCARCWERVSCAEEVFFVWVFLFALKLDYRLHLDFTSFTTNVFYSLSQGFS